MQLVMYSLHRQMERQQDQYANVLVALEDAFSRYEAGKLSINGYLDIICAIDRTVRRERPLWLRLCDRSMALRWINNAERRSFRETCDALEWCRNWAIRQRGMDITTCLENAQASMDFGFVPALGVAA